MLDSNSIEYCIAAIEDFLLQCLEPLLAQVANAAAVLVGNGDQSFMIIVTVTSLLVVCRHQVLRIPRTRRSWSSLYDSRKWPTSTRSTGRAPAFLREQQKCLPEALQQR